MVTGLEGPQEEPPQLNGHLDTWACFLISAGGTTFMVVGFGTPVVSYAPRPMLVSERIVGIL